MAAKSVPAHGRQQRADAERNRAQLLDTARVVVAEQGTTASLREIARRAEVSLPTLYRHFATRDALLESLLAGGFQRLTERAETLSAELPADEALQQWVREVVAGAGPYRGLPGDLARTLEDRDSALWSSCHALHEAGQRLLQSAQAAGSVRPDVTGTDIFALIGAATWVAGQGAPLGERRDQILIVMLDGLRPRAHPR